jgi:hypothetical protein
MPGNQPQVGEVWTYEARNHPRRDLTLQIEEVYRIGHGNSPDQTLVRGIMLQSSNHSRTVLDLGYFLQNYTYHGSDTALTVDSIDPDLQVTFDPAAVQPSVIASEEAHRQFVERDAELLIEQLENTYQSERDADFGFIEAVDILEPIPPEFMEMKVDPRCRVKRKAKSKVTPKKKKERPTVWDRLKADDND